MIRRIEPGDFHLFFGLTAVFVVFAGLFSGSLIQQQWRVVSANNQLSLAAAALSGRRLGALLLDRSAFAGLADRWEADCDKAAKAVLDAQAEASAAGFFAGSTPACFQFRLAAPIAGAADVKPLEASSLDALRTALLRGADVALYVPAEWPGLIAVATPLTAASSGRPALLIRAFPIGTLARLLSPLPVAKPFAAGLIDGHGNPLLGNLPDGRDRVSIPLGSSNASIVMGPTAAAAAETHLFWAMLAVGVTLLAWGLTGFGWAIKIIILRRLDTLRRVARIYSRGRFSARFRVSDSAPREIADLGWALNDMADNGASQVAALQAAAAEESRLILELHHRVKNNFQVLESLLSLLKKGREADEVEHLRFVEDHVRSMAVADRLAYGAHGMRVSIDELISGVVEGMQTTSGLASMQIRTEFGPALGTLDLDRAVALCLCLAVTLPPYLSASRDGGGPVKVSVERRDSGTLHLTVAGPPPSEDSSPFLRKRLIQAYLGQLDAVPGSGALYSDGRAFSILIPNIVAPPAL